MGYVDLLKKHKFVIDFNKQKITSKESYSTQ